MTIPYIQLEKISEGRRPTTPESVKARVMARVKKDPDWGEYADWNRQWRGLPLEFFQDLTPAEKVALVYSDCITSHLGDHLEKEDPTGFLINRIRLCLWYYCCTDDWNTLVEAYTKVCTFDFGEPGFTVTIDHPLGFQGRGTGEHSGKWIDGGLAFMLHYKGELVAIMGFSVSGRGLLIQQAQMMQKKGNRWMYKLHGNLLDVMVDKLERHFACPTWIVDGVSQATYLNKVHALPVEEIVRIAALYDAPLKGFRRTEETLQTHDWYQTGIRKYHLLERTA